MVIETLHTCSIIPILKTYELNDPKQTYYNILHLQKGLHISITTITGNQI